MSDDEEAALWGDPTPAEIEAMKVRLREAHYAVRRGDEVPEELRRVVRAHEYYGNGNTRPVPKRCRAKFS